MPEIKESVIDLEKVAVSAYKIPAQTPESDGTISWNHTTLVLAELSAGGITGMGYTYADLSTAYFIRDILAPKVQGMNVFDIPAIWREMTIAIRNLGRPGVASMAISAVDNALWDLKAKLLGLSLTSLWGKAQEQVEVYGSGGFTNYDSAQMNRQLDLWKKYGIRKVKIKVGSHPEEDVRRTEEVHNYLGSADEIFVDANGAYSRKQALQFAREYAALGVTWFEEPVSSDDVEGLAFLTANAPAEINIASGEYGYDLYYFKRFLEASAVDIVQVDVTRCGGYSNMFRIMHLAEAYHIPVSTHCAPYLHLPAACASDVVHMEYFYDHVRIETMLFDGVAMPDKGCLFPDLSAPGIGMTFKKKDAEKFLA